MTDLNQQIVKEEAETEAEIQRKWRQQDQNRRTKRLTEVWPNRANYEATLKAIQNVNSGQGLILITIVKLFA